MKCISSVGARNKAPSTTSFSKIRKYGQETRENSDEDRNLMQAETESIFGKFYTL